MVGPILKQAHQHYECFSISLTTIKISWHLTKNLAFMQIGHSNSFAASGSTQSASCPPWRAGGFTPQGSTTSSSDRFPYLGVGWQQVRMSPWVSLGAQSQFHFGIQDLIPVSTYREKNIPVRVWKNLGDQGNLGKVRWILYEGEVLCGDEAGS